MEFLIHHKHCGVVSRHTFYNAFVKGGARVQWHFFLLFKSKSTMNLYFEIALLLF